MLLFVECRALDVVCVCVCVCVCVSESRSKRHTMYDMQHTMYDMYDTPHLPSSPLLPTHSLSMSGGPQSHSEVLCLPPSPLPLPPVCLVKKPHVVVVVVVFVVGVVGKRNQK